jgi:DNA-binding transcriptional ArsR family regulator
VQTQRAKSGGHANSLVGLDDAIKQLSALAQDARLEVFRLLVAAGETGLAAGEIARRLDTPANTLSAQLLILSNARLVTARRNGRSIIYAANFGTMRAPLIFLVQDCCDGRPESCEPLAATPPRLSNNAPAKYPPRRKLLRH